MLTAFRREIDGPRRVLERHVTKAPLLMQKAEPRAYPLEAVERCQRFVETHEMALARCREQKDVPIVRSGFKKG